MSTPRATLVLGGVYADPVVLPPHEAAPREKKAVRHPRRAPAALVVLLGEVCAIGAPRVAAAQAGAEDGGVAPPNEAPTTAAAEPPPELLLEPLMRAGPEEPPPSNVSFLQYGVAFTAEVPTAPGPICATTKAPCILGTGGGVAIRVGYRSAGHLYVGAAYEVTKQDPNNLYRIGLLQQARAEGRYYLGSAREAYPYGALGLGLTGYGNEWAVDTWGPSGSLGLGIEVQIAQRTVVGAALAYRLAYLSAFVDTSGAARDGGVAQIMGLDLVLEQRDSTGRPEGRASAPRK